MNLEDIEFAKFDLQIFVIFVHFEDYYSIIQIALDYISMID